MDLERREEYKNKLYEITPPNGKLVSNLALRESLKESYPAEDFAPEDYWDLRNSLITDGRLEKGRGYGGSVRRVALTEPIVTESPCQPVLEASLYAPFQQAIQNGYVPDNDLKPWVCEVTASQGRRNTGGLWTRPDITLVAMQTFLYVPGRLFQVITFEIKPSIETAMAGVYEAAAHSAFAHRSYLAFPDSKEYDKSPLFDRIATECERFALGLILFKDAGDWDTFDFQVSAPRETPDEQAVNDFIKTQINEKNREEIQRWFR